MQSLPSRERGLKLVIIALTLPLKAVAPFAGAWIEINPSLSIQGDGTVAPFAGAWIEICCDPLHIHSFFVAPFAGAWIEIGRVH